MSSLPYSPPEVLLVEDNAADARLTAEALRQSSVPNKVHIVEDGEQALAYLQHGEDRSNAVPALILLDLNLPKINGLEVLAELKKNKSFRRVPVVILTSSSAASDVAACYDLQANGYVVKSRDLNEFLSNVKAIGDFWLSTAKVSPV